MQLTIEQVTTAKTGKSLRVLANGVWYGAKKDAQLSKGMTIEAETSDGDYGKWIDKWMPVAAPVKPNGSGHVAAPQTSPAPIWLQMASNTVAHALNAGVLKTPDEIKAWVLAVKNAVEGGEAS